jgi:hypothetical protein
VFYIFAKLSLACGKPVFAHEPVIAALPPGAETCVFPLDEPTVCSLLRDPSRLDDDIVPTITVRMVYTQVKV